MPKETETLRAAAERIARKEPDVAKATALLVDWINEYPEILQTEIHAIAHNLIHEARHRERRIIRQSSWREPDMRQSVESRRINSVITAANAREDLAMLPVGSKFLRDCTAEDLLVAAVDLETQAAGSLRMADYYRSLAGKLRNGETVRQRFNAASLRALYCRCVSRPGSDPDAKGKKGKARAAV